MVSGTARYPVGTDISLSIDSADANTIVTYNSAIYTTALAAGFDRNFEVYKK